MDAVLQALEREFVDRTFRFSPGTALLAVHAEAPRLP